MFLTYVFLGSSLSLLWCLFSVTGKRSCMTGSVMVAPKHLRFWDRMSRPSLGDIRNTQPPPPATFTTASRQSGTQDGTAIINFQDHPSLPRVFTKFCSNLHSRGSYFSLTKTTASPTLFASSSVLLFPITATHRRQSSAPRHDTNTPHRPTQIHWWPRWYSPPCPLELTAARSERKGNAFTLPLSMFLRFLFPSSLMQA